MVKTKKKTTPKTSPENMAVVYARYSSHNQQEQSIEGQLAAARKYADDKGYTIIGEYCDRAKTGTNDNREAFQKMLADCAKHKFSVIIVWKVDRFGRNREEITFNKYRAKKHGVRVEYVAENISQGPEGVILESVLEGMAEYFSLQLSQNVRRGFLESAKKHQVVCGRVPLGYRIGPDKTYEINPETAPVVKQVFSRYAAGESMADIIRWLNDQGYRTGQGKPFTKSSLVTVLKNEKYIGIYTYKDVIRDENAVPVIVDREIFAEVQDMLKKNKRMPSHSWSYSDYILTDKLFCGLCGSPMVGKSGNNHAGQKYMYYACSGKLHKSGCTKKAIRQDVIEELVLTEAHRIIQDDEIMGYIVDKTWEFYQQQDASAEEIKSLQRQLEAVEKSIGNLVRSIEAGLLNDAIVARMNELEGQKTALSKAIGEKELEQGFKLTRDHIQFFLEQFRDLNFEDRDCQRRLVDTFINSVHLYEDKYIIAFNYSDETKKTPLSLARSFGSNVNAEAGLNDQGSNFSNLHWVGKVIILVKKIPTG